MSRHTRLLSVVAAVTAGVAGAVVIPSAAQAADGAITVTVVRDNDSDGSYNQGREPGQPGIPVKIFDAAGAVAEATTNADGKAEFAAGAGGLAGGKYRVEATIPASMPYLKPAPAFGPAPSLAPLTTFVDVTDGASAELTMGVHNPADYVQANPLLASPLNRGVNNDQQKDVDPALSALVAWPYDRTGNAGSPRPDTRAIQGEIGTTYGLAWQRSTKYLFTSALAKRHTHYGPLGSGGIYLVDESGKAHDFAKLTDAGSTEHAQNGLLHDSAFYDVVGKQGLGDLDLSEDEKSLYAVNLATRSLLTFDVAAVEPGTVQEPVAKVAIPDPGCVGSSANWRPWAIGVQDGRIYVGGVCSAQSTQKAADLALHVLSYNPAAGTFRRVFSHSLDLTRGLAWESGGAKALWNPWQSEYDSSKWQNGGGNRPAYPQPILTDLEFDRGSLIFGLRDRFGDQLGSLAFGTNPTDKFMREPTSASGDIKRACWTGRTWEFEGEGACPNHYDRTFGGNQPEGTIEYYPDDHFLNGGQHQELASGALSNGPRFGEVISTFVDPWEGEVWANGVRALDNNTGKMTRKPYTVGSWATDRTLFGKANGLGDLEFLADPAPLQLGDRVWFDADADGTQDGGEPGIAGVEVALTCKDGTSKIASTNVDGSYVFNDVPANTACTVAFDAELAELPEGVAEGSLKLTKRGSGGTTDSNPDPATGTATVTTGGPGANDHTIDAGYTAGAVTPPEPEPSSEPEPPVVPPVDPPVSPYAPVAPVDIPVGEPVNTPIEVTSPGGGPYTFTVTDPGKLPAGLEISGTGVISGSTTATGTYPVPVKVCDGTKTCALVTVTLNCGGKAPANQPPSRPTPAKAGVAGTVGVALSGSLTSVDPEQDKVTFTVVEGTLPPGVQVGADGAITGTPTREGDSTVTVRACDGSGACSSSEVTFSICGPTPTDEETPYRKP